MRGWACTFRGESQAPQVSASCLEDNKKPTAFNADLNFPILIQPIDVCYSVYLMA